MDSRRNFLAAAAGFLFAYKGFSKGIENNFQDSVLLEKDPENIFQNETEEILMPKALRKGSVVAITAPASPTSMGEISYTLKVFKALGCEVIVGDTITKNTNKYRYFSVPDEIRAAEFMDFVRNPEVNCILCARGGYGVMRILPMLDFSEIRMNPKVIVGFSDITGLINPVLTISRLVSFHGPVASSEFNKEAVTYFTNVLFENPKFKPIKYSFSDLDILNKGKAEGLLVGGNLSLIASTLGTPFEIDTKDAILLLEEVSEEPYKIDRMLTQLWLAGKLQQCKGIVIGSFKNLDSRRHFFPNMSYTVRQVVESRIKPLGIPSYIGLPAGHTKNNLTLPLGINVEIDANAGTFTILEQAVKN